MSEIDWQAFAAVNGLDPEGFTKEVLSVAACLGAMKIDESGIEGNSLEFKCSDNIGPIKLTVCRVNL